MFVKNKILFSDKNFINNTTEVNNIIKSPVIEESMELKKNNLNINSKALPTEIKMDIINDSNDNNRMMIGISIGAGIVIFILIFVLLGYQIYTKRRNRKTKSYNFQHSYQSGIPSQVTLLPIQALRSRSHLNIPRQLQLKKSPMRSPPPYNESFLDNGGPVVAV